MANADPADIRADAHKLIDSLPLGSTWDDIMYRIYVRQAIDKGIADAENGDVVPVDEVRRRFGLST